MRLGEGLIILPYREKNLGGGAHILLCKNRRRTSKKNVDT